MDTNESRIIATPEVDIFYTPPTEGAIQKRQWVQYRPVAPITDNSPLEFYVPGTDNAYIDFKHSYFAVTAKVLNADDTDCNITKDDERAAPVNLPMHSLFNQVDMYFNQKLVSGVGVNYPYKAILDTLIEADLDSQHSELAAQGFAKDDYGIMDVTELITGGNTGLKTRYSLTGVSQDREWSGRLHLDICEQSRFILNGLEIKLALWPSKESFRLMSPAVGKQFKMSITSAVLHICKITLSPYVMAAHGSQIDNSPAIYPMERSHIKAFELNSGKMGFDLENIFLGNIPRLLVVAFVSSEAYQGSLAKNPYNFQHKTLDWLSVQIDDTDLPFTATKMEFDLGHTRYLQQYRNVMDATGRSDWMISPAEYRAGYTLFVYNLLSREDKTHLPVARKGNLRLQGTFKEALDENTTVICYAKFPASLKINKFRDVEI
jgi:hypothetical protein